MRVNKITEGHYLDLIYEMGEQILAKGFTHVYGIPRNGTQVAVDLVCNITGLSLSNTVWGSGGLAIVDDLADSGVTAQWYLDKGHTVFTLFQKRTGIKENLYFVRHADPGTWIQFPWEKDTEEEDLIRRCLQYIGEDPLREGLRETPGRVLKAWKHWYSGYGQDPASVMKTFEDDTSDEMILLKDIEFYSHCEHHMTPFVGKAHIAYIPNGRLLGASKLARVLDIYARRLQIQERIARQVVDTLEEYLKPLGAACYLEAKHLCISSRGVEKQNSVFCTSALTGVFKSDPKVREEFFSLVKGD